jgi:hypothetical protein
MSEITAPTQSDLPIMVRIEPWIFRLEGLSLLEKLLMSYIFGWSVFNKCCVNTPEWLAYKFGFTPQEIETTLSLLQMSGHIEMSKGSDGNLSLWVIIEGVESPCSDCEFTEGI